MCNNQVLCVWGGGGGGGGGGSGGGGQGMCMPCTNLMCSVYYTLTKNSSRQQQLFVGCA